MLVEVFLSFLKKKFIYFGEGEGQRQGKRERGREGHSLLSGEPAKGT